MSSGSLDPHISGPSSIYTEPVTGSSPIATSTTPKGHSTESTLQPSTQEQVIASLNASYPMIAPPAFEILFSQTINVDNSIQETQN